MPSAVSSSGDARTSDPLSQFAATTSAQFAGVISDETGTGNVVLDTSPRLSAIELGDASDTTITRSAAGTIAVEGNPLLTSTAISDSGFSGLWSGVQFIAPSKNAIYDYIHRLDSSDNGEYANVLTGFKIAGTAGSGKILIGDGTKFAASTPTFPSTATSKGAIIGDGTNFVTSGTGTAVTLGTIELGAASDTTLSRAAAGILAVEGVNVATTANIDDSAFASSWDAVTTIAPSKNAVYDYLNSIKPFADAPAQLVNIAATNAVISKTGVTVTAGDRFEILCEGAIINNSGATRQYQIIYNFGSLSVSATDGAATSASATGRELRSLRAIVGIKNTSSAWISAHCIGFTSAALGSAGQFQAGLSQGGSQQSSSNLTGSQNINITFASNVATPTQTFEVTSWRITKLATNP